MRCCAAESSTSAGIAQIDFTGVEMASASPLRSTIVPRVAGTSMHARVARVALALQELGVERLEIERAPAEQREARGER